MPLATVVEPETNRTLLCMLRRRFKLANGEERCLCLPLDHPIDVLRGEGVDPNEDLSDIGDDELKEILPDMASALASKGMLLQRSAFCMTVRGAVRFNETDALLMDAGDGAGDETEGIEILTFSSKGSRYLVYAPMNPVLLVTKETSGDDAADDAERRTHLVVFDDEDDEELERNVEEVMNELEEDDDPDGLFDDLAYDMFEEESGGGGGRGGKGGGGRGGGGRGGGRGRGGRGKR